MVTVQAPVPEQAPLQPEKVEPLAANGVSVTIVPLTYGSLQSLPQLMPAGRDVTVPPPVPDLVTLRVKLGDGVISIQLTLKRSPTMAIRRTCCPAERLTPVFVTSAHVCQPPVDGTTRSPVLFT